MADEPVPIGQSEPLSGLQAMSIIFPGTCLAIVAVASFGGVLANLNGHLARAGFAGLVTVVSGALLVRFLRDFIPQRAWLDKASKAASRSAGTTCVSCRPPSCSCLPKPSNPARHQTRAPETPASNSASSPRNRNRHHLWTGASGQIRKAREQLSTTISTTRPPTPAGDDFT